MSLSKLKPKLDKADSAGVGELSWAKEAFGAFLEGGRGHEHHVHHEHDCEYECQTLGAEEGADAYAGVKA